MSANLLTSVEYKITPPLINASFKLGNSKHPAIELSYEELGIEPGDFAYDTITPPGEKAKAAKTGDLIQLPWALVGYITGNAKAAKAAEAAADPSRSMHAVCEYWPYYPGRKPYDVYGIYMRQALDGGDQIIQTIQGELACHLALAANRNNIFKSGILVFEWWINPGAALGFHRRLQGLRGAGLNRQARSLPVKPHSLYLGPKSCSMSSFAA